MMNLLRTNSNNKDFINLVALLDAELAVTDGDDHEFYNQFNKIDKLKYAVVAFEKDNLLGCGALKKYGLNSVEVKRMFVLPDSRGQGIASKILTELENWASELGFDSCVLETGKKQPEAVQLYKKSGYQLVPNFGQYVGVENSLCFEKRLTVS